MGGSIHVLIGLTDETWIDCGWTSETMDEVDQRMDVIDCCTVLAA